MNETSLAALRRRVRPVELGGTPTLEQASAAVALNRDVAQFHAAVNQAERILELAGALDGRLERELAARAIELAIQRERLARDET